MHPVVMESLEEYLAGTLKPAAQREIEAHLSTCRLCRDEIRGFEEASEWFGSLRTEETVEPALGFYGRVMAQAGDRSLASPFAAWFPVDFAFGRRLIFAAMLTFAVLGTYLISREATTPFGPSPETVMAQQESPSFDSAPAPDNMLVTLTDYEH